MILRYKFIATLIIYEKDSPVWFKLFRLYWCHGLTCQVLIPRVLLGHCACLPLDNIVFETLDNIMLTPTLAAERFHSLWKFLNRQMSLMWEERWSEPLAPWPIATYFHALPLGGRYKFVTCLTSSIAPAAAFVHSFSDSSAIGCSCSSCRWIKALYSLHAPCSDPNLYTAFLKSFLHTFWSLQVHKRNPEDVNGS